MPRPPKSGNRPQDEESNPRIGRSTCGHCGGSFGATTKYGYCHYCRMPIHMTMTCIQCNRTDTPEEPAGQESPKPQDRPNERPARKQHVFRFEIEDTSTGAETTEETGTEEEKEDPNDQQNEG